MFTVPALFGKDLPPCGAEIQVAYDNVNTRLRQRWLSHRGQLSASDICQTVKEELSNQNLMWPAFCFKAGQFKKRKPWRRENVFHYEVRWIDYFVREAQAPEPMTESEIVDREKQPSVPNVLGFTCDKKEVLELWDAWHTKKRARAPAVPGTAMDAASGLEALTLKSAAGEGANRVEEDSGASVASSVTVVEQPAAEHREHGEGETQAGSNAWCQDDHD